MNTPFSTPIRQAKLGIASTKSHPLANEYKKRLNEQYQRLWTKHQQDLDLIDDIRHYVKARLSIERDYNSALGKLGKQHSGSIAKKFVLLTQCDPTIRHDLGNYEDETNKSEPQLQHESEVSDSRLQKRLANTSGLDEPDKPCSLYKVWSEHINRLQATSKNRADQFEQLLMVVDKLKDIRSHKAYIGKKCLDTHLRRIHEDILVSMVDVEKARKLYYEDESQAKKARENEEKIKKKRSGLLTKFTDLQAKKEKTSAQREANDIQSTQARNDYIMALAAANAHLQHYYQRNLADFIYVIDDGVLDHCKIFMATLSECDINSLKDTLTHAQYWSKMINLTGSQKTNSIFLECEQSSCLRDKLDLVFEACNDDPIHYISLEHNADYALQHEIDKWFTWFKKECRNLSQLMHQLEKCQRAFSEGKKSVELNGQNTEDLEGKIVELKQQIRKSEAAKLKAQARLKVIKEGGMQIEEWSAVESEIRRDMARAQEEVEAKIAKEMIHDHSNDGTRMEVAHVSTETEHASGYMFDGQVMEQQVQLQVSKDANDSDPDQSIHNFATVSRSASNLIQKQQNAKSGYSALTDPSQVWQDDYSGTWGSPQGNYNVVVTDAYNSIMSPIKTNQDEPAESNRYDLLGTSKNHNSSQQNQTTSMTVQSFSPLSAIVDGLQSSPSPYQGMPGETHKSDYECDYNRTGQPMRSTASSAEPYNQHLQNLTQTDPFGKPFNDTNESKVFNDEPDFDQSTNFDVKDETIVGPAFEMINRRVVALYKSEKTNEDDLDFNENDILRVIEVNDANWFKARNELTGKEGYIPSSYVALLEDSREPELIANTSRGSSGDGTNIKESERKIASVDSVTACNNEQNSDLKLEKRYYCRALYDYERKTDTLEEDGLPHLGLVKGELMRIINKGEGDGWWLLEREDLGIRGYVPSVLVEEMDLDADDYDEDNVGDEDEEEEYEDQYDEYSSQCSTDDEFGGSVKAMPSFDPPVLKKSIDTGSSFDDRESVDNNNNPTKEDAKNSSSLIPMSFIIIEPTPEVESKRIDDDSIDSSKSINSNEKTDDRQIVYSTTSNPPNYTSYSVVNEEFVLEGPTRKPYHYQLDQVQYHETPTILEENFGDELSEAQTHNDLSSKTPDGNYEPLSEVDSLDMPAPPSVVIENFEDDKGTKSPKLDDGDNEDEDESSLNDYDSDQPIAYVQKEIKHTGNVDVNPMLRLRAEEFSKQIIAEAIMLAPGADVGPSTSSPK